MVIKNKGMFFISLLVITTTYSWGQKVSQRLIGITNKSIKFRIIKTPTIILDSARVNLSQTLVDVVLSKSSEERVKKLKAEDWISLLSNSSTDWAANLCLYEIYKRDAVLLRADRGRGYWVNCCKEKDIVYWRSLFKTLQLQ